jgi:NADPH:quinone reductase-like Zn-dependent oxidoreductase
MPQAIQYSEFGGPDVLHLVDVPVPDAPAEGLLVELRAVGVNPFDLKQRAGIGASGPLEKPRGLGSDASGVVLEVGTSIAGWSAGEEVIVSAGTGAYATHIGVAQHRVQRKPLVWTFEQAAAVGVPVGTAYQVLKSLGVGEGTRLLVHAGSGAVGQAAVQFAVAWGATVVATASPAKHDKLRALGAIPVAYGDGLVGRVREAAPEGIDLVLDAAGTDEALDASFELVSDRSRIGTIVVGNRAAELGIRAWSGGNPVPLTDDEQRLRREGVGAAAVLAEQGRFVVEVAETYPLGDAAIAHERLGTGEATGKIVLIPSAG